MLGELLGGSLGGYLGQAGDILSAPRRGLWSLAQKGVNAVTGSDDAAPETGAELLGRFGMDEENPLTQALGFGAEIAGDPLTYLGGAIGRVGGKAAGLGKSAFRTMKPLRNEFAVVKNVRPEPLSAAGKFSGRVVGPFPAAAEGHATEMANYLFNEGADVAAGVSFPGSRVAMAAEGAPSFVPRHEMIHQLIDRASEGTRPLSQMPLSVAIPAAMKRSRSPFGQGMAYLADEAATRAMTEKSPLKGAFEAGKFLLSGKEAYADELMNGGSPLVGALYRGVPDAMKFGAVGTAAGMGGMLGYEAMKGKR